MYSIKTADICPVSEADICLVSTADICPVSAADMLDFPAHLRNHSGQLDFVVALDF